jgi:hypothetical protein
MTAAEEEKKRLKDEVRDSLLYLSISFSVSLRSNRISLCLFM